jgi:hypothetical protein
VEPQDSSAFITAAAPSKSYILLFLLLSTFLIGSATAKVVPSLATAKQLAVRQSSPQTSCSIEVLRDFTTLRINSLAVTDTVSCGAPSRPYCGVGFNIDTGIRSNNRTINDTTAAEPQFDAFFDLLSNRTGHFFPAMSSVELMYRYLAPSGLSHIAFTPILVRTSHDTGASEKKIQGRLMTPANTNSLAMYRRKDNRLWRYRRRHQQHHANLGLRARIRRGAKGWKRYQQRCDPGHPFDCRTYITSYPGARLESLTIYDNRRPIDRIVQCVWLRHDDLRDSEVCKSLGIRSHHLRNFTCGSTN